MVVGHGSCGSLVNCVMGRMSHGSRKMTHFHLWVWVLVIALLTKLEQQRFTILEVTADWHELMIPWRIMRPSIARDGKQLDPRCSTQTYHPEMEIFRDP